MWECNYGKEPFDMRLFVLRFLRKSWMLFLAAFLGALLVGGPYFLRKVTFGPAKEYEAVTDLYIDYAVQETGEMYTYINQHTWNQLVKDDVFTDRILSSMSGLDREDVSLEEQEKAAGVTKSELREYLYATMLSDTRIVTTTVTTNSPELTMRINKALIQAMFAFGAEQKEIAEVRILHEPVKADQVIADVRTFRACMLGVVIFVFVTALTMLLYYVLDEGIYIPATFERRYGVYMLGTIRSAELPVAAGKLFTEKPTIVSVYKQEDLNQVKTALQERGVETAGISELEQLPQEEILLIVKAGVHNGKPIEKALDFCKKCGLRVSAALLWDADEGLIRAYELPEHVFRAKKAVKQRKNED